MFGSDTVLLRRTIGSHRGLLFRTYMHILNLVLWSTATGEESGIWIAARSQEEALGKAMDKLKGTLSGEVGHGTVGAQAKCLFVFVGYALLGYVRYFSFTEGQHAHK